jgi:hypothetical protein
MSRAHNQCIKKWKLRLKTHALLSITVANFSPEHSGTEKDQRRYPLCLKSEIFIFIMKSFIHEKSLLERIFIIRFSSVNKFSIICNEIFKFTTTHGIINFSAYLWFDHFYTQAFSFVTPKIIHNTEYSLHKIIPDLHISVYVSYYESLYKKKVWC